MLKLNQPDGLPFDLFGVHTIAESVGVSRQTIYNYISAGHLVPDVVLPSGRKFFYRSTIVAFLESMQTEQAS